jgi:hypothetical protein
VLLGAAVAVYLALSLFDHAAQADTGSIDHTGATDPVASVKSTAAGARKVVPEPKSTARKVHPQGTRRSTSKIPTGKIPTGKMPEVHRPKVQAPKKIHPPKTQEPRKIQAPSIRVVETVRRVQVRASKLVQLKSEAIRDAARATVTAARTAVVRQKLSTPTQPPSLPERAGLPHLTQFPSWPQLPTLPQDQTPVPAQTAALPSALLPNQALMPQACPLPQPPAFAPALGPSGVIKPPAAKTQPSTAPPEQPANYSTSTGQAHDSGGGNPPTMGTVPSSWRAEVTATGRRLATDFLARGRTVRYAGPPS